MKYFCLYLFFSFFLYQNSRANQKQTIIKFTNWGLEFKPKLGGQLRISPRLEQSLKFRNQEHKLYGFIHVIPPKGKCVYILHQNRTIESEVCKPKNIAFFLSELLGNGTLVWHVLINDREPAYKLIWKTPYRFGRFVDYTMKWPGYSKKIFIKNCVAEKKLKRVKLSFFYKKSIFISFPKIDELMKQPHLAKPNLYLPYKTAKKVDLRMESMSQQKTRIEKENAVSGNRETISQGQEQVKREHKQNKADTLEDNRNIIHSDWQLHPRGTFKMNGSNFMGNSLSAKGVGECLYKYQIKSGDKTSGVIECKSTYNYKWLYFPLTCLSELK